jgi:hypothetical protein
MYPILPAARRFVSVPFLMPQRFAACSSVKVSWFAASAIFRTPLIG